MTAAQISPEEWSNHLELEGRVLGEYHRLAKATVAGTNETARLAQVCSKLDATVSDLALELKRVKRRTNSLVDEAEVEDRAATIIRKRFRALRGWLGWGVATALGLLKLYEFGHQAGWWH